MLTQIISRNRNNTITLLTEEWFVKQTLAFDVKPDILFLQIQHRAAQKPCFLGYLRSDLKYWHIQLNDGNPYFRE